MQEGTQVPQWLQLASSILAGIVSGIGIDKLYNSWLNRKKPTAELHVTEETATEIRLRSHSTATDIVVKMMNRLDEAQITIDRLRSERDEWEMRSFDLEMELKDSRTANGLLTAQAKLDNYSLRKQMAFIEMKNLKNEYISLDTPKDKQGPA